MIQLSSETIWALRFHFGEFLIKNSISFMVIGLFRLSISSYLNFSSLWFLRNCSIFFLSCHIYEHTVVCSTPLFFLMAALCGMIYLISFLILVFCVLFLSVLLEVCQIHYFFEERTFCFLGVLFSVIFSYFQFYFLYYLIPAACFGFILLLFLVSGGKKLLIWHLSSF